MSENKKQQRSWALARRDEMDRHQREQLSAVLVAYANDIVAQPADKIIAGFWPIRSEIDPRPLMFALHKRGAQLALPTLTGQGLQAEMVFRAFEPGQELVDQGLDTLGPAEDAAVVEPDIILLPLAAFDAKGNRIGYGGGFYDRTLKKIQERGHIVHRVGLGFDCQEIEQIAAQPHDMKLDAMLTPNGLRNFA